MLYIIANARYKGGLSGSDNIYLHFQKHFPVESLVFEMMNIDFRPFWLCYLWRIIKGCFIALRGRVPDIVYSASDFLMDSLPAFIYKLRGSWWAAGFYLYAPKDNILYRLSQLIVRPLINRFADVVMITNESMKWGFKDKETINVNGGYEKELAYVSYASKEYDAVFCGRIHSTKGIDELLDVWIGVTRKRCETKLAIIGDGDLGIPWLTEQILKKEYYGSKLNIVLFGYMGNERFDIYRKSKMFLYTSTNDHFSMAPVEAMACGCPMVAFDLPVMKYVRPQGCALCGDVPSFSQVIIEMLDTGYYKKLSYDAVRWAESWEWETNAGRIWKYLSCFREKSGLKS